ncbi:MAG: SatD family protein [Erysipelotrichales bacterium]|nr:SatD family protein [Erysipelotrichales bacterium]
MFAALLIDIKNSRELSESERMQCQDQISLAIEIVNSLLTLKLEKKLVFSSGDSIQGLFLDTSEALKCFFILKNLLYPFEIRGSVGYGKINDVNPNNKEYIDNVNFLDGEAFHRAAEGLDIGKKSNYNIIISSEDQSNNLIVNQMLQTIYILENMQTKKQKEIQFFFRSIFPYLDSSCNIESYLQKITPLISKYTTIKDYEKNMDIFINLIKNILPYFDTIACKKTFSKDPFLKSMNEYVAALLEVSRENIRQIVAKGKFNEIRKLEIVTALLLTKLKEV